VFRKTKSEVTFGEKVPSKKPDVVFGGLVFTPQPSAARGIVMIMMDGRMVGGGRKRFVQSISEAQVHRMI